VNSSSFPRFVYREEVREGCMDKKFVSPDELAQYLDISVNTVYSWVCLRKIPFIKMGRLVKFDLRKIDDLISEWEFKANN
jgi:excisionase family DNA binding protein